MLTSESRSGRVRQRTHLISISSSFGSDSSFPIAPLDFRATVHISYIFSDFTTILFVHAPEIAPKSLKKEKYQVFLKWPFLLSKHGQFLLWGFSHKEEEGASVLVLE